MKHSLLPNTTTCEELVTLETNSLTMAQQLHSEQTPIGNKEYMYEQHMQMLVHINECGDRVFEPLTIDMGSDVVLKLQCKLDDGGHHEPHNVEQDGDYGPVILELSDELKSITNTITLARHVNEIRMRVMADEDSRPDCQIKLIVIGNLKPASSYTITITQFINATQVCEVEKCISTKPPFGPPDNFRMKKYPHGKFLLTWKTPYIEQGYSIDHYSITLNNFLENDISRNKINTYSSECQEASLDLEEETSYIFQIRAHCGEFASECFTVESILPKHLMLKCGYQCQWKGVPTHLLFMQEVARHKNVCRKKIEKQISSDIMQTEKVVLIVGETGSGKTTWINAALNHIMDVKYTDNFRFKLVMEENDSRQELSQTKNITIYTIQPEEGCNIDYTLTLIDTPGFGDPEGIEKDLAIGKGLLSVFDPQNGFVDHLDAIGFVANGTRPRLTQQQKYIFSSVLDLFGSDVAKNIYILFTFSGKNEPLTMSCVTQTHMPHKAVFKFDNGSVFEKKHTNDSQGSSDEDEWEGYETMAYKMTMKNFQEIFRWRLIDPGKEPHVNSGGINETGRFEKQGETTRRTGKIVSVTNWRNDGCRSSC